MRVGLVGLGQMGRHHARLLSDSSTVEFVGAVDPEGDRHGVMHGGPVFDTVSQMIDAGLDAAIVAVPTADHRDVAVKLAENGVSTLVEKPLAESVQSAEVIVDAFAANGVLGAVGHVERFNSSLQEMKKRLDQ